MSTAGMHELLRLAARALRRSTAPAFLAPNVYLMVDADREPGTTLAVAMRQALHEEDIDTASKHVADSVEEERARGLAFTMSAIVTPATLAILLARIFPIQSVERIAQWLDKPAPAGAVHVVAVSGDEVGLVIDPMTPLPAASRAS